MRTFILLAVLVVLLIVTSKVDCYGRLERTYTGKVCGAADPKTLWYEEVNASTCSGVGTTNCTTSEFPKGTFSSSIATCSTGISELQGYVTDKTYYYWTSTDYVSEQCDGGLKRQRYTGAISSSCIASKTEGTYYKHVCNKDGEMTLTKCSDSFCYKCSGTATLTNNCIVTKFGSTKVGCTACPTCKSNGATRQMTFSVGALLIALLCYLL